MTKNAYTLLKMWSEDGNLAMAYPAVIDGQDTVVCVAIDPEPMSKCMALISDPEIRAMFHIYVLGELKRRARQRALDADLEVEL